ncbi:MAG: nucleotidyltransferase family protein [Saprospiraceae bacterium]|jgi:hypothetical protein
MDKELQARLIQSLLPYHPAKIGVFGSFARGENKKGSDLDVLVQFREQISLLKLVQIEQELGDQLGIPIDLVTENSLKNPRLKEYIIRDLITIYEWKKTTAYI